jgi:hypothetical protein
MTSANAGRLHVRGPFCGYGSVLRHSGVCSRQDCGLLPCRFPRSWFRLANGIFTAIDGPGASLTVPSRSNNLGQAVGAYVVPDGTPG